MADTLARKFELMDIKANLRHRSWCTYDPSLWSNPDGDFCTCDLHERKQAVAEEIAKL